MHLRCAIVFVVCLMSGALMTNAAAWAGMSGLDRNHVVSAVSNAAETGRNMAPDYQGLPPGPVIVSQIHNAPGWEPSHSYDYATGPFTRVVNGPGWNPTSRNYTPGQPLAAYQLTSPGTCHSAKGDGPRGVGVAIKDGTCTWKYLSRVDYISITGWAFDNRPWKSGTLYHYLDDVTTGSPLRTYALQSNGCRSTVAPSGTGNTARALVETSDGCHWQYVADIIYSSKRSHIPTETFTSNRSAATLGVQANYVGQLWNDREYVAGEHHEASPIRVQGHDDFMHEGGVILGCVSTPCFHIIVTTAPGESFRDKLTPDVALAGFDPRNGVAIRNNNPYRWPYEPAGIDVHDNYVDLIGLQIKSVHGPAVNGMSSFGNKMTIRDCILDGGSSDQWTTPAAASVDTSSVVANSLVISHAPIGILFKYPGFLVHTTIVHAGSAAANSVGVMTFYKWVYTGTVVSNTAIFGFAHAAAHVEGGTPWSQRSSHNMTDAPAGDSGTAPSVLDPRGKMIFDVLPGATFGVSMARAFVKPGADWRPSAASPLRGSGSPFGRFAVGCAVQQPSCPQRTTYEFDSPNIIGVARPQHGQYNIGSW